MAQAHRADEYIEPSQLAAADELLRVVVDQLCAA
jgi:acetylornithine deacetylase/succinyl-diaminopimelate desuccinylase-like protein